MRFKLALYLTLVVFLFGGLLLKGAAKPAQLPEGTDPFPCGSTTLKRTDYVSATSVSHGSTYAVISVIENVGTGAGWVGVNYRFDLPGGMQADGSTGPNFFWLKPGQKHAVTWQHTFGCVGRPLGEYDLGVGTYMPTTSPPVACHYNYYDVVLTGDTLCSGFPDTP